MNILIISPEPWETHQVSKHHYARTLARRGHRVLFFGPPELQAGPSIKLEGVAVEPGAKANGSLSIVRAPKVAKGLKFYPAFVRRRLESAWLAELESEAGLSIDIVWLFENSRFFDMSFAGERTKIYHRMDVQQNYRLSKTLETSDVHLTVTRSMLRQFRRLGFDGEKIEHGHADQKNNHSLRIDSNIRSDRVVVAYVGNIDIPFLDHSILAELIEIHKNVDFHFIGRSSRTNILRVSTEFARNVFWWGRIESAAISSVLRQMDILLVTYDFERFHEHVANTHKLMEYMASGVVTVATYTEDYADKRHLLAMVDRREDFLPTFAEVVANLDHWNAPEKRAERQAFAADNTYDRQIERIDALLKSNPQTATRMEGLSL